MKWKRDVPQILPCEPAFPDMRALAEYVHSKGLRFGIYTSWGGTTCLGRPGSHLHFEQDAETYASWGVDFVKLDSCGCPSPGCLCDLAAAIFAAIFGPTIFRLLDPRDLVLTIMLGGNQSCLRSAPREGTLVNLYPRLNLPVFFAPSRC